MWRKIWAQILINPLTPETDHLSGNIEGQLGLCTASRSFSSFRVKQYESLCVFVFQSEGGQGHPQEKWTGDPPVFSSSVPRLASDRPMSLKIWLCWRRHSFSLSSVRVRRSSSTETVCVWGGTIIIVKALNDKSRDQSDCTEITAIKKGRGGGFRARVTYWGALIFNFCALNRGKSIFK